MGEHALVAGIDIGGTKIAVGAVDVDGRVLAERRVPTPARAGAAAVLAAAGDALVEVWAAGDIAGIGVSTGGIVDVDSGRVVAATDLIADWVGASILDRLSERFGVPVAVDNDGNAFALAEHRYGAARGCDNAICVAVGTGIGGGLVLDRRIRRGPRFLAGELGHLPGGGPRLCSCGRVGHIEGWSSGPALTERYREAGGVAADLREVVGRGDERSAEVIRSGGWALGQVLGGLVNALDVDVVVVGGGVAQLGGRFLDPLREGLAATLIHGRDVPVRAAELGASAGVVGGAAVLRASRLWASRVSR
jgi:glucokinase